MRLATLGAAAFGLAGVALAAAGDAPSPAPFLLGATTALLGSVLCPLVVGGVLDKAAGSGGARPSGAARSRGHSPSRAPARPRSRSR